MKSAVCLPRISWRSSSEALKIFFSVSKRLSRAFAFVGPMFGNPSRMNCCCSGFEREILEARMAISDFSFFLAITERCFAVSSALRVIKMGVSNSKRTECMKPRMAFSCRPGVL